MGHFFPNEPYSPDGMNQLAALTGHASERRVKPLYWKMQSSWPARTSQPFHWVSYATVDQNWKLVTNSTLSYSELFDLSADAFEATDLKEQHPEVVKQLLEKISQWKETLPSHPTGDVFSAERSQTKSSGM
jgi:hypothetical protein